MRLRSSSDIARSSTRKSSTARRPEHAVGGKHDVVPLRRLEEQAVLRGTHWQIGFKDEKN
jgi:hypothetical protein